jgi:hypothetical protein
MLHQPCSIQPHHRLTRIIIEGTACCYSFWPFSNKCYRVDKKKKKTRLLNKKQHTSPTAIVMICGVKPIPAEPDSHSPSKTITVCIIQIPQGQEQKKQT